MSEPETTVDIALIGGGIMSATLGTLIRLVEPTWSVAILERLDDVAQESSNPWNNAGTGHAALCELNYTPERPDGSIDISKAVRINEQFEASREFWNYLSASGLIPQDAGFLSATPHVTFVRGEENVDFLRRRHEALVAHPHFRDLEFSADRETIASWAPLLVEGRDPGEKVAATRSAAGTDVDFGALTRALVDTLVAQGAQLSLQHDVTGLRRRAEGGWHVDHIDRAQGRRGRLAARFVFVGAGGAALPLLQKAGIPEAKGYGGFPISGQFLRTDDPEIVARHAAKVYGRAEVGSPPMSVPHLDTRVVDGRTSLLFGPYAGFSTKFLKHGSWLDLFASIRPHNLRPMLSVARDNTSLIRYLIREVTASRRSRLEALRAFMPTARDADWRLVTAGQRVQVMKKDAARGGVLEFGTEVVTASDGSLAGLLGASPGASTAVSAMLDLLERCFPDRIAAWHRTLRQVIPSLDSDAWDATEELDAERPLSDSGTAREA